MIGLLCSDAISNSSNFLLWVIILLFVYSIVGMVITTHYSFKVKKLKKNTRLLLSAVTPLALTMYYQALIVAVLALFAIVITYNMVSTIHQYHRLVTVSSMANDTALADEVVATDTATNIVSDVATSVANEVASDVASDVAIEVATEVAKAVAVEVVAQTPSVIEYRFIKGKNKRYSLSFVAKVSQLHVDGKQYYNCLKNALMRHDKVRDRQSWFYDSIYRGRVQLAKFAIRGKTLCLYLALNADDYIDTKYLVEKVTTKKYQKTPCLYKIKNPRRVKYALELIDTLVTNNNLVPNDREDEDYVKLYPKLIKEV